METKEKTTEEIRKEVKNMKIEIKKKKVKEKVVWTLIIGGTMVFIFILSHHLPSIEKSVQAISHVLKQYK